ncbi:LuxR C-terminal-related transcriptional regulator [Streptomyces spiramyceticus]|uniref:LuxR C-terminal-related transcriptional regulator n=1 Tax=Streptomyces spiramyceticus TaxID=299717 RepID=UPI00237B5F9E|nr:LuxR C-terminal-related transcriptional regulator [Streptomyces spiramyceticus]
MARAVKIQYNDQSKPFPVVVRDRLEALLSGEERAVFVTPVSRQWMLGSLALVSIFQMAEDLTDQQAAFAVSDRLSWIYALGRQWEDPGLDPKLLSQFRSQAAVQGLEERMLGLLLDKLNEQGLVAGTFANSARAIAALKNNAVDQQEAGPVDHTELASLTVRERQIADLVSGGRTNQQIARELSVSPKTIESHLTRIFGKLGICSRAQIAEMVGRSRSAEIGRT